MGIFNFRLFWKETKDIIFRPVIHFSTLVKDNTYPYAFIKAAIYLSIASIFDIFSFIARHQGESVAFGSLAFIIIPTQIVSSISAFFVEVIFYYFLCLFLRARSPFRAVSNVISSYALILGLLPFVLHPIKIYSGLFPGNSTILLIFTLLYSIYGSWIIYIALTKALNLREIYAKMYFVIMVLVNLFLFVNYQYKFLPILSQILPGIRGTL